MKVVFLDFDGVLNSEKYIKNSGKYGVVIDPSNIKLLKTIVDSTGARIVLSSSWREHWEKDGKCCKTGEEINKIFADYGMTIYDKTPKLHGRREQEIETFLLENTDVTNFVVLDDCFLSSNIIDGHFVKTSFYKNGLEESNVLDAIKILGEGEN